MSTPLIEHLSIFCPLLLVSSCLSYVHHYTGPSAYLFFPTLHLSICLSFIYPYNWASAYLLSTPTREHLPIFCPPQHLINCLSFVHTYTWASSYLFSTPTLQHLPIFCLPINRSSIKTWPPQGSTQSKYGRSASGMPDSSHDTISPCFRCSLFSSYGNVSDFLKGNIFYSAKVFE